MADLQGIDKIQKPDTSTRLYIPFVDFERND